jgi:thiol-disulfide isomerase/thioredoxin
MKKMKRIFFYLFLALGLSSCSKNSTKVNIEIPEMNEGKISIVFANPDQVSNTSPSIIYSESFKDSKIEINLDSIKFEKDFIDCALLVTSNDESFFVNVPLPVERGKTIDVKFTNVEGYKKGEKIKLSYKGTKHAEDFTIFWDKIQDQLLEFSKLPVEKINEGYKNFVPTYKTYIDKHPQSGFPYMLLISQVNNMQFDKTNPLLDYCNTICSSPKDNRWKEVFCTLIGEKKLAQETSKKLVFQAVDLNGKSYTERDIKGKLIIVDFWASWCRPCKEEMPHFKQINDKYKSQGLTMIGISIDRTEREWRNYISSNPVAWLSLYGDGNVFTKRYDFQYIPYNLIADSEGNILAKNLHGAELDKFLEDYFSK